MRWCTPLLVGNYWQSTSLSIYTWISNNWSIYFSRMFVLPETNKIICRHVDDLILWIQLPDLRQDEGEQQHLMISYQWDEQPTMLKIRDALKKEGYKVWMDVDKLGGSTLEAMAAGIENAAVVLIAVSRKYKQSVNCRSGMMCFSVLPVFRSISQSWMCPCRQGFLQTIWHLWFFRWNLCNEGQGTRIPDALIEIARKIGNTAKWTHGLLNLLLDYIGNVSLRF